MHDLKIAVIGCGSIGKRHIRNLISLGIRDVMAFDISPERTSMVTAEYGIKGSSSLSDTLAARPDAIILCTSPSSHVSVAMEAAKAGCHLFIEKPLSHTLEGLNDLLAEVDDRGLTTLVGSNFKFHPSFKIMKELLESDVLGKVLSTRCQFGQYLPDWHPWEDYRKGYSARPELGGGILLDSHEFDYIQWFLGDVEDVFCLSGRTSSLEIDTEDTAEVLLRFSRGTIGEIHLDYTQRTYQRNYEFFGENGTLKWDFNDRRVWLFRAKGKFWEVFEEPKNYDLNNMYVEEMAHFLDCVQNKKQTITDIRCGLKTLQIITAAKISAKAGQMKRVEEVSWS